MNEIVKAFSRFVYRDAVFVLAGATLLLALFPRYWSWFVCGGVSTGFTLFMVAVAYVLGYVVQDVFSLLRVVTTAHSFRPWRMLRRLVEAFEHRGCPENPKCDAQEALLIIDLQASEATVGRLARISDLMQLGTAVGPSWLVSGLILLLRSTRRTAEGSLDLLSRTGWRMGLGLLCAGITLCVLGWLKAAQRAYFLKYLLEYYQQRPPAAD